jgi:hypothetical protein
MFLKKNPLFEDSTTCGKYKKSKIIHSLRKNKYAHNIGLGVGVSGA